MLGLTVSGERLTVDALEFDSIADSRRAITYKLFWKEKPPYADIDQFADHRPGRW